LCGWKSPTAYWVLTKKVEENKMFRTQILIILLLVFNGAINAYAAQIKSSLVTGATTGLGRYFTETLASNSHHINADARTDQEMAELNAFKAGGYLTAN
jgi:hypothetical protein